MEKTYLSKEKHKEIQEELERLKSDGRRAVAERLKAAKDLGDLSENSDYQEARDDQARLESRIAALEEAIRNSVIVEKSGGATDAVRIGSKVKIKKGKENFEYTIVGSNESDPAKGLVSNASPMGLALMGKRVGEKAVMQTPKGAVTLEVLALS